MSVRLLAISLLTQDDGISQEAYDILYGLLEGDEDITQHVEATDGRFYLPEGWEPQFEGMAGLPYLEQRIRTVLPAADIQTDNDDQLIVYTGLMLDEDGNVVDYEPSEDAE